MGIVGPITGGDGGGGGGSSFAPTKRNIFSAVKAIFHPSTNAGVSADDPNSELDISGDGGGSGEENVQADWTQTDSSKDDFIKHKPELGTAATKDVGGAGGVAGLNSQGTLFSSYFPSYVATDQEVANAIAALKGGAPVGLDTLKELADAIGLRLNDRGGYLPANAYKKHDIVRHTMPAAAHYVATRDVPAGKSPGVSSDWKTYWARIGFEDGPPNAFVGAALSDKVLTFTREGGTNPQEIALPTLEETNERIEKIEFDNIAGGDTDLELTPKSTDPISVDLGDGDPEILSDISGNDFKVAPGLYLVDFSVTSGAGSVSAARNASLLIELRKTADNSMFPGGSFTSPRLSSSQRTLSVYGLIYVAAETSVNFYAVRSGGSTNVPLTNPVAQFVRFGGPRGAKGDPGPAARLAEVGSANFNVTTVNRYAAGAGDGIDISGISDDDILAVLVDDISNIDPTLYWFFGRDINDPVAADGVIADNTHIVDTPNAIKLYLGRDSNDKLLLSASSNRVHAQPLTLYKMGTSTAPPHDLHPSITDFEFTSGNADPVAGSIAGNVYNYSFEIAQSSHVSSARIVGFKGTAANPTSVATLDNISAGNYHGGTGDVVIPSGVTLAANETYTVRLEVYRENQNPATELPTAYKDLRITAHAAAVAPYHVGYVRYNASDADAAATLARITDFSNDTATATSLPASIEIDVPSDSNEYQIYLAAKASETQPSGFTSAGLPASGSFYDAQDKTIGGVDYKFYILRPTWRVSSSDNGDTFGVTHA